MSRMSRVVLIRHGRTVLNAEGRIRGLADPELDEAGVAQARAAGEALRDAGITRVITSPLKRAVATGRAIAETVGVTDVQVDEGLNDRDYGEWTGQLRADVVERWGSIDDAPGVEPRETVRDRALRALDAQADRAEGPLLVVSHDAVIRPLLAAFDPTLTPQVDTGSWVVLTRSDTGWVVESVDNHP
ncbi:histidine phosphatase family protein [Gordonia shandongensis]|uniref:histidine phosphatase family protein n=1 Tax=Gordonia shandongensis TaxID=376351 RepID=UPI0006867F68|nr:histidine phosphatase family protein [Gordonia shandongensis]